MISDFYASLYKIYVGCVHEVVHTFFAPSPFFFFWRYSLSKMGKFLPKFFALPDSVRSLTDF